MELEKVCKGLSLINPLEKEGFCSRTSDFLDSDHIKRQVLPTALPDPSPKRRAILHCLKVISSMGELTLTLTGLRPPFHCALTD